MHYIPVLIFQAAEQIPIQVINACMTYFRLVDDDGVVLIELPRKVIPEEVTHCLKKAAGLSCKSTNLRLGHAMPLYMDIGMEEEAGG